jgi:Xaa-Pro aminopeptidase
MFYEKYTIYSERRERLLLSIRNLHNDTENGVVVLCAALEGEKKRFRQESTFYYFTGIIEPGAMLTIDLEGIETLYIPRYEKDRRQWVEEQIVPCKEHEKLFEIDRIEYLGEESLGYALGELFQLETHAIIVSNIQKSLSKYGILYGYSDLRDASWQARRFSLLCNEIKEDGITCSDISSLVATMRRKKDREEIRKIEKAAQITALTQDFVARLIHHCEYEYELQSLVQYSFLQQQAMGEAFPSIVAAGKNAATLHYTGSAKKMLNGELVVVDIGAEYDYYCADVTRTYPVSGRFTGEQKKLYQAVLDVQNYVASLARPGVFLNNKEDPGQSLHHLAVKKLEDYGYAKYFVHGIGHFLGLDVHDVGSSMRALQYGDVITIEPGIYISQQALGIRIEDDFLIELDGCRSLSGGAKKEIEEIEKLMKR